MSTELTLGCRFDIVEKQPDLLDKLLKTSLRDSLIGSDEHSKFSQSLQQQGKNLYYLEDFSIAPNKQFLQELQAYGFGNHDAAFILFPICF